MKLTHRINIAISAAIFAVVTATTATSEDMHAKSVVLVHGAFADGSSWQYVTPILQEAGLNVIVVQNPMESLAGDVEFVDRALARAEGPVVLVGHSWGGQVITEAGVHDKVYSLVYVAAYAPDAGQALGEAAQLDTYPAQGLAALQKDPAGFFYLPDDAMAEFFAHDLSAEQAKFMAASQGLINSSALGEPVTHAAWETKPSFYAIAGADYMTPTALQHVFADKIGATSRKINASHSIMLSQPQFVADLIIEAAK